MSLDSITETIAHFIGTFELTVEQARLRDQYDEFTAYRKKAELDQLDDPTTIKISAKLEPDPVKIELTPYRFQEPQKLPDAPPPPGDVSYGTTIQLGTPTAPETVIPQVDFFGNDSASANAGQVTYVEHTPEGSSELLGSVVTYTMQYLFLSDNDTLGQGDFRDTDVLIAEAEQSLDVALSLHAMSAPSLSVSDYLSVDKVEALAQEMLQPLSAEVEGVTIHQFHGADAIGVIVNGEYVDEMPVWNDLLPAYHKPEETSDEDDQAPTPYPDEWEQGPEPVIEDGHTVITGGNLLINEINVTVGWVDAPYIALGGQSINLTMFSQVAVVSDMDEGSHGCGSGTNVVQAAQIDMQSNPATWIADAQSDGEQPSFISVDWIQGDLVVANFIKQVIDATDIDHINTEVSASSSYFAMGDNQLTNLDNIMQLGSYYDLIMIGGDMISLDMLFQTIVLMDDDVVEGGMPGPGGAGDENLVMNHATLNSQGQDTHKDMDKAMADVLALPETNQDALEEALLNDPLFAGLEQMRVLKVDGSLLQVNIFEQVSMLADQDDVELTGAAAGDTDVIAGSNAILNSASINKLGIDSVVMANSETYSDLLLHQASLIDTPEDDNGDDLVNEAVAFLMDDPTDSNSLPGSQGPDDQEAVGDKTLVESDGMQSMLA